jgi:2-haloacid dehalogenase
MKQAATAAALAVSTGAKADAVGPASAIKAIAFDGFVVFDPRPITALAETLFPGHG